MPITKIDDIMTNTKKYTIFGVIAFIILFIFSFENNDISKVGPAIKEGCVKTDLYVVHVGSDITHEIYDCSKKKTEN